MPEQGRIRTGAKTESNGKERPSKLETFRFTSSDEEAIDQIAALYGGEPRRWAGAPTGTVQWEVYTERAEIDVVLTPSAIGDGVSFELWAGGYNVRRCDGVSCDTKVEGPEGMEPVNVPCICENEQGATKCKGKLRLTVILPRIKFGGGWRLDTSSENALRELPGMIDLILALQQKGGLTNATLVLDQRSKPKQIKDKKTGQIKVITQKFGVPMLKIPHSMQDIQSGAAALGAPLKTMHLGASEATFELDAGDSEPAEAEVVADTALLKSIDALADKIVDAWNLENFEGPLSVRQVLQALAAQVTGDSQQQVAALTQDHAEKIHGLLEDIISGTVTFRGVRDGRVKVER